MNLLIFRTVICAVAVLVASGLLYIKYCLFLRAKRLNPRLGMKLVGLYPTSTIEWEHSKRLKQYMKKSNVVVLLFWVSTSVAAISLLV